MQKLAKISFCLFLVALIPVMQKMQKIAKISFCLSLVALIPVNQGSLIYVCYKYHLVLSFSLVSCQH